MAVVDPPHPFEAPKLESFMQTARTRKTPCSIVALTWLPGGQRGVAAGQGAFTRVQASGKGRQSTSTWSAAASVRVFA